MLFDDDNTDTPLPRTGYGTVSRARVQIEVILVGIEGHHFLIREDEDAPVRWIGKSGVQIRSHHGDTVILEMSEHKAISYNLA